MDIIIIAELNFPEGMAATAHVTLMAKGLIENGTNVFLAIPSMKFNRKVEKKQNETEGIYNSIPYKFFNKYKTKKNTFTFISLRNIFELSKFLKERKKQGINDIILTYNNDFLKYFPVFLTCYFHKIPFFPWEVEKRISNKSIGSYRTLLQQLGFRISDIILPKISNGIIVISSLLKNYYGQKMDESKIHISPILVDPEDVGKIISLPENNEVKKLIFGLRNNNRKIIVYSGSFGEKDGFPYILKAIKLLKEKYSDVILITTGKPGKYNPIEKILAEVETMGLTDRFKHLGLVSRNELKFVNQNADLLLVCRSNSEFANYGFPWKLGEYLMTKNPIVATKVGDIEKYLIGEEEIFLAEPENHVSICQEMTQIFDDYEKARIVAMKGYKKALKVFGYKSVTQNDIRFIESKIGKK